MPLPFKPLTHNQVAKKAPTDLLQEYTNEVPKDLLRLTSHSQSLLIYLSFSPLLISQLSSNLCKQYQ